MSAFGSLAQAVVKLGIQSWGDGQTLVLTRSLNLFDAGSDAPVNDLQAMGVQAAGASTLTLHRPSTGPLAGKAPAGITVTLEGTEYTVEASAETAANVLTISVSPVLVAEVADATAATFADVVATTYKRLQAKLAFRDLGNSSIQATDEAWDLLNEGSTLAPDRFDRVGSGRGVVHVETLQPGAVVSGWRVLVGSVR